MDASQGGVPLTDYGSTPKLGVFYVQDAQCNDRAATLILNDVQSP